MKTRTSTIITRIAALACGAALAGCAASPSENVAVNGNASGASAGEAQPPMTGGALAEAAPSSVQFNGMPVMPAEGSVEPSALGDGSHGTRLVGLFGEFDNSNPAAGTQYDGGRNLAQITTVTAGACVDPDVDRTGSWLAFASTMHRSTSDIYMKSVRGETLTQITDDPADDVMPCFSPDGKSIAFASNRTGNWDIFTTTLDGKRTIQITSDNDQELHPTWSPDGRYLAYCKLNSQSTRWEIWTVDVNATGTRDFLCYGLFPQWSPDPAKNKILFQRARQRGSRDYGIWTIDVINDQAMYPTEIASAANAALINPAWSPDGNRIVFVSVVDPSQSSSEHPGQSDLWVVNLDGTGRTSLTNGQFANFQPVWAGNGSVFFITDRSGFDNVWAIATDGDNGPAEPAAVASNAHHEASHHAEAHSEPHGVATAEPTSHDSTAHP